MIDQMNRKALLYLIAVLASMTGFDSATAAMGHYIEDAALWSSANAIAAFFWFALTISSFRSAIKTKGPCVLY